MKTNKLGKYIWREKSNFHDSFTAILFWILTGLIACLIFLIPSNLFVKCCETTGYVNGLFIDYLLPKFFVSDVLILAILILGSVWLLISNKKKQQFNLPSILNYTSTHRLIVTTLLLFLVLGMRQVTASHPMAALWYFGKLVEVVLLGFFLAHFIRSIATKKIPLLRQKKFWLLISLALAITICFQSCLAIFQYTQQHELVGFHFLGEPQLTQPLSLARITLSSGTIKVLPYGTTAHPNVLAGVIAIYLLLWFLIQQKQKVFAQKPFVIFSLILLVLGCSNIYITRSFSAWATVGLGVGILIFNQYLGPTRSNLRNVPSGTSTGIMLLILSFVIIPLSITVLAKNNPVNMSLTRRSDLQQAAIKMLIDKPLVGVGLNNFSAEVENYTQSTELVRFVQPVHHVGWLWLSETGMLGLAVVALTIWLYFHTGQNSRGKLTQLTLLFLMVLPIFSLDHYLLSIQTGMLLGVLSVVLYLNPESNTK